jgi:hypothetical protein
VDVDCCMYSVEWDSCMSNFGWIVLCIILDGIVVYTILYT